MDTLRAYRRTDWSCPYCDAPIPAMRRASACRAMDALETHLDGGC